MAKWKLFGRSKSREEEIVEPRENVEEIVEPRENVEEIVEPRENLEEINEPNEKVEEEVTAQEEEQPLTEYKETLYTGVYTSKKGEKQVSSDQRIWRDINSIEKNIDNLHLKEAKKPITELEKKVDLIISKGRISETQKSRKPSNIIYVVSKPQPGQVKGDWAVRGHSKIYSHHRKKQSAVKAAKKIAKEKGATVLVQKTDGTFSESYKP